MSSAIAYRVYLTDEYGERIHVGDLMATGKECAFRYKELFWRSKDRFSIDPINLPIERAAIREQNILFGVFKDSLPDAWGLTLMAKRFNLPPKEQSPHLLLQYLDRQSIGALSYENITGKKRQPVQEETIKTVGELADRFKIDSGSAAEIVDEVVDIVSANWHSLCARNEVPQKDIDHFYSYIKRQADKLTKPITSNITPFVQ